MKTYFKFVLLFSLLSFTNGTLIPDTFTGKVVGVKDGDTIEVLFEGSVQTVRLLDIDCPEKSQAFGMKAKQFTSDFCFGKIVTVENFGKKDKYDRILGTVTLDGKTLNEVLLKAGYAWHYKKYSDKQDYADMENNARKNKLGLWVDENPIAPWDYRKK
jgi:micrococcal nuclease